MTKVKIVLPLLLSLMFIGCASVPKANQTQSQQMKTLSELAPEKAGIYVYRDNSLKGAALKKDIWINGECLGETSRGVFFYKEVDGGKDYVISTESEFSPNHLSLPVEAGKFYYIQQKIKMGAFVGGAKLEQVEETNAKNMISKIDMGVIGKCSKQRIDLPKT